MDIVITARHATLSDRFRRQAEEKLEKVAQLAPRAQRIDVLVSHEQNPRQSARRDRVELTVRDRGPVIRAEACADDLYAALDIAQEKLLERLRRARDKRKVHYGRQTKESVRFATPVDGVVVEPVTADPEPADEDGSPIEIREKVHQAAPMTVDDALYQMELVGHDFYLFVDVDSSVPSVVYRRRGWSYGVLRLDSSVVELVAEQA